ARQRAGEVVQGGKIQIYRMLEHVTRRVASSASARGRTQTPTMKGNLSGLVEWPIFTPGAMYAAGFPDEAPAKVSADLNTLSELRFPPQIIQRWAGSIKQLNQLQIDAINDFGLLAGQNVVVSAPTSSGKTMVGELAAIYNSIRRRRALFLFPLKALVNDKHRHFRKTYGDYGIRTIRATGDSTDDVPGLMRGQYDVCLMTYEKFSALALRAPHIIDQVGTVIVDEVQMIADPNRGVNLEFILTL